MTGENARTDWWKDFFQGLAVDFWRAVQTEEATLAEADFLETNLGLSSGDRVLDAPCGDGRLSLALAARGYGVTGVDISAGFLEAARASARARNLEIAWRHGDMRDLPWEAEFAAAFCSGSSFGYFDDAGNEDFLEAISRALKPGGRFLLETGWAAEAILSNFRERLEAEVGGIRFLAENRYDPAAGRVESRFTISRGERTESRLASHRIYTYREITRMLEAAGFGGFSGYGGLSGEPFRPGSPKLLLLATKGA